MRLKDNLKDYRKFKGWTQERMASEFGVNRDNVASYERGLAMPSLEFACKICDDINVSLHVLLYDEILNPKVVADTTMGRIGELEEKLREAYKTIALMTQEKMKVHRESDTPLTQAAEGEALIKKKRKAG